jgi:hypothetical protein
MNNRLTILAAVACMVFACSVTFGQSRMQLSAIDKPSVDANARAIAALSRLDQDVIVYGSLGDFEEGRKLSRVPVATFAQHFDEACAEVMPLLDEMPASKFKTQLTNALDSYRDGLFWWRQAEQPRVVSVANLGYASHDRTPADAAWLATLPYTVAIHWRQAHKYLKQAEQTPGR